MNTELIQNLRVRPIRNMFTSQSALDQKFGLILKRRLRLTVRRYVNGIQMEPFLDTIFRLRVTTPVSSATMTFIQLS